MFIKTIKQHPILLLLAVGFFVYLGVMLPKTKGPVIYIETDQPTDDYVVTCSWASGWLVTHGGRQHVASRIAVIKSGETFDCGYSVIAALTKGYASVSILHPVHIFEREKNYQKEGVDYIVMNKTKLDLLDEQKAKFEAGYWDKARNPAWEYLGSRPGCGFPYQYFEYYKQAKRVKVEYFKNKYQKPILECAEKSYIDTKKYDPHLAKKLPEPTLRINQLWESIKEYEKDD